MVPGAGNASPFHWLSRWQTNMSTARRVEQDDWDTPRRDVWVDRLVETVGEAEKPVILVAHALGVLTVAHAAPLQRQALACGRGRSHACECVRVRPSLHYRPLPLCPEAY